jgi:hypothetical protein
MIENARDYDVIVDFWEWYQRRQERRNGSADFALDKCEATFARGEWDAFGYWHTIYLRERLKHRTPSCTASG